MTTYRITARETGTGIVVYLGAVEACSERLAVRRAMESFPKYAMSDYVLKAEPMLLRWPSAQGAKV